MKITTFQISLALFLLIPPLLAAPTTLNPHSPSNLLSPRHILRCFHDVTNSSFATLLASDCTKAARQIICTSNIVQQLPFSSRHGVRVPRDWVHGTCHIAIDIMAEGDPTEMASLGQVFQRAMELIGECVLHPTWKYGGRTTVGRRDLIHVAVTGTHTSSRSRDPARCLAP